MRYHPRSEASCQLLRHFTPAVQYPTISSDVSIPLRLLSPSSCHGSTTAMLCWWAYQPTCTPVCSQCSTLLRDPSPVYDAPTTSPTHSPVSTGWRSLSVFTAQFKLATIVVHWTVRLFNTWLCLTCRPDDVCLNLNLNLNLIVDGPGSTSAFDVHIVPIIVQSRLETVHWGCVDNMLWQTIPVWNHSVTEEILPYM